MAHPYESCRQEHRDRAHAMIRSAGHEVPRRASGGGITKAWDEKQDEHDIAKGVHAHESHLHKGQPKTKLKAGGHVEGEHARHHLAKRARGGSASKGKGHVTNVIVAPQGGGGMRPPMQPPAAMQAPPRPAAPPMPPPHPAVPPQQVVPQGMPPGGPPMGMRPPGAMKRGGGVQKMQEVGVPAESLMQSNRGGKVRKRDVGGSAGVPADPTTMNPQQLQRIAQIRKAQAQARAAQQQGGMRPGMQGPMSAAQAAGMGNMPMQKSGGEVRVKEHTRRARGGHVPDMEAGAGGGEGRIEKARAYGSGRGFKPKKEPLHA